MDRLATHTLFCCHGKPSCSVVYVCFDDLSVHSLVLLPLFPCFAGFSLRSSRGEGLSIPVLVCVIPREVWKPNRLQLRPLLLALGLHLGPAVAHSDGDRLNFLVSRTDSACATLMTDFSHTFSVYCCPRLRHSFSFSSVHLVFSVA